MGSLGAYKKCKTLLLQKHHNSSDFLDITKPTLEKTHTRATKTSLTKTLQKWCFYEFGPIPERTLTRATLATKPSVAETSPKCRVSRVCNENEGFLA